jgi:hypothetical protein
MCWERGRYYTRTRKVDGGAIREYLGRGPEAHLAAALDAARRQERKARRLALQAEAERRRAVDLPLRAFGRLSDLLAGAALVLAGFHRHDRGPWRKVRQPEVQTHDPRP